MAKDDHSSVKEIRTFLALELPDGFKKEISDLIEKLQQMCPHGIKWVKAEHLHITLQFIGDTPINKIEELSSMFESVLKSLPVFNISSPKIEAVPPGHTRLIWVKCSFEDNSLTEAVKTIKDNLKKRGFQIDRKPFRLHITLGRVRRAIPEKTIEKITGSELEERDWTVGRGVFFESRLYSEGPEYRPIAHYDLKNK